MAQKSGLLGKTSKLLKIIFFNALFPREKNIAFYGRESREPPKNYILNRFSLFFSKKEEIMLENKFKQKLVKEIKELFPDCIVIHPSPNEIQGIPDLLVLNGDQWAALEGKKSAKDSHRPNQDYYIFKMQKMGYASFIYPENKDETLESMKHYFSD